MFLYIMCFFFFSVRGGGVSLFQLYSVKLLWFILICTLMDRFQALLWKVLYEGKTKGFVKSVPQSLAVFR